MHLKNGVLFQLLIGLFLSIIFLWLAFRDTDWHGVSDIVSGVRWIYLPVIFVVWWFGIAARAVRWHILMDERLPLKSTFHINNVGILVNNIIPFRIGEFLKVFLVAREGAALSGWAVLSSIFTERILDVLALVVLLVAVLPFMQVGVEIIQGGLLIGAAALSVFIIMMAMATHPTIADAILRWLMRYLPILERYNLTELLKRVLDGLKPLTSARSLLRLTLWTVIVWLATVAEAWAVTLLFPHWPANTLLGLVFTVTLVSLSFLIPFTPAGAGPFEAASIFALTLAGVQLELATTFAVVWHVGILLYYALWGTIGLLTLNFSPRQVLQMNISQPGETHL